MACYNVCILPAMVVGAVMRYKVCIVCSRVQGESTDNDRRDERDGLLHAPVCMLHHMKQGRDF